MTGVSPEVRICLFGPVQVTVSGTPVTFNGTRMRTLVAVLAVAAGESVPLEALADRIWGDDLPDRVRQSLHAMVFRLRRAVGADVVRTAGTSYCLAVRPEQVDVLRFERALREAAGPDAITAALAVWTGQPFLGTDSDWLSTTVLPRLEELRLGAIERRADLVDEPPAELLAELRQLTGDHPLRESLWVRLLRALVRTGRSAEALGLYDVIRSRLADELGVGPGPELQALHAHLLATDTALHLPADRPPSNRPPFNLPPSGAPHSNLPPSNLPASGPLHSNLPPSNLAPSGAPHSNLPHSGPPHSDLLHSDLPHSDLPPSDLPSGEPVAPEALPAEAPDFLGRDRELAILTGTDGPLVAAIDGMPGVGKTALALRAAHRLTTRYPDGQVFLDLHGHSEGVAPVAAGDALGRLLVAFGVPDRRIPLELEDRAGLLRSLLARRRVLIVLDNAATEAQVRPLLPGTPDSGVIVTSRLRLTGLDATAAVSLETLEQPTAIELFTRIAGPDRVAGSSPAVLAELVEWCGRLPLALRISAARLRTHRSWRPEDLLDRLRNHERLAELTSGPRSVAAAIDLSYRELSAGLRRGYRLLGVHPGAEFRVWSAAPLLGLDTAATTGVLERLLEAHLLEEPVPGRYRFHDLVKDHAARAAEETPDDRRTAVARIVEHYCQSASEVAALRAPELDLATHGLPPIVSTPEAARDWIDNELPTALLVQALAPDHCVVHLAESLYWCLRDLGQYDAKTALLRRALAVVRASGDVTTEVNVLNRLGEVSRLRGSYPDAIETFGQARTAAQAAGYRLGELRAIEGVANVYGLQEHRDAAVAELRTALGIAEEIGDEHAQLDLLNAIGWMHVRYGEHLLALDYRERALAAAQRTRPRSTGKFLAAIGHIRLQLGELELALDYYERALEHARATDNRHNELRVLDGLAHVYLELGRLEEAEQARERTLVLAREMGSQNWLFEVHQGFGRLRLALAEPEAALAAHQRALELATALHQPVDQARAQDGLGDALAMLGRGEEAARRWRHALSVLEAVGVETTDELGTSAARLRMKLADVPEGQPVPGPAGVPTT